MDYRVCNLKRTIVARFDDGEDLLLSLTKCAEENGIKAGYFSLIGALKRFAYGLYEEGKYRSIVKEASHCFELIPVFGNVSLKEGKALIHAHVACADEEAGGLFGGHLMEGSKIYPFTEVVMQEFDLPLDRTYDPKTNLWPIQFK